MKKLAVVAMAGLFSVSAATSFADTPKGAKIDGKKEFMEHCNACHADGGNMINPKKTLKKADRAANGVKKWQDIRRARFDSSRVYLGKVFELTPDNAAAADEYGMAMAFSGLRLFHH